MKWGSIPACSALWPFLRVHDPFHRRPGAGPARSQFDPNDRNAVDQEHGAAAAGSVVRIDGEPIDDLVRVPAPVPEVHEGAVQRSAVGADERVPAAEGPRRFVHVRRNVLAEEAPEFAVGQGHAIQGLELFPKFASCAARSRMPRRW